MGTWRLSNFTNARVIWVNEDFGWDISGSPTLDYQPPGPPSPVWGRILIQLNLSAAQLFLDGSSTPVSYDDLPDNFGIDEITCLPKNWMKDGVNLFTANFPVCQEVNPGGGDVFRGAASAYYWTIEPVGLGEYQLSALTQSDITLADPYDGIGYPPVFTKWNGFLRTFLSQASFNIVFQEMSAQFGAYLMNVFLEHENGVDADGFLDLSNEAWSVFGTYDEFEPPPNPLIYPIGGVSFGGDATFSLLLDASGIYTLTPDVYHDELYQRTGTTATTTNVMIPNPFFKTGFIGDK